MLNSILAGANNIWAIIISTDLSDAYMPCTNLFITSFYSTDFEEPDERIKNEPNSME